MDRVAVIGAGLTGATVARVFAENNIKVHVYENMLLPGGLCSDTNVGKYNVNLFGPHIFHTNDEEVQSFITRFCTMKDFDHKVLAKTRTGFLPWPINGSTLKMIYGHDYRYWFQLDVSEAIRKYSEDADQTFDKKAKQMVGQKVYEILIKDYTEKQWGVKDTEVPPEILTRIPVREDKDPSFFQDKYVTIPVEGYTAALMNMLDHENILVSYCENINYRSLMMLRQVFDCIVSTAPPDKLLRNEYGELEYRKVLFKFNSDVFDKRSEHSVINDCTTPSNWTRTTDYSFFSGVNREELDLEKTTFCREYPGKGKPCYPVLTDYNKEIALKYVNELLSIGVFQAGRLGEYRYYNMDQAIRNGIDVARGLL